METVVLLYASVSADASAKGKTDEIRDLFEKRGVPIALLDGAYDPNRELRSKLFNISGARAKYPQVFIQRGEDYTFVGLYDEIHDMNETNQETGAFDRVFGHIIKAAIASAGETPAVRMIEAGPSNTGPNSQAPPVAARVQPGDIAIDAPPTPAMAHAAAPSEIPVAGKDGGSSQLKSAGWRACTDSQGSVYYWNDSTKQSSWVDPAQAAAITQDAKGLQLLWVRMMDETRGRSYYYCVQTGASAWKLPV